MSAAPPEFEWSSTDSWQAAPPPAQTAAPCSQGPPCPSVSGPWPQQQHQQPLHDPSSTAPQDHHPPGRRIRLQNDSGDPAACPDHLSSSVPLQAPAAGSQRPGGSEERLQAQRPASRHGPAQQPGSRPPAASWTAPAWESSRSSLDQAGTAQASPWPQGSDASLSLPDQHSAEASSPSSLDQGAAQERPQEQAWRLSEASGVSQQQHTQPGRSSSAAAARGPPDRAASWAAQAPSPGSSTISMPEVPPPQDVPPSGGSSDDLQRVHMHTGASAAAPPPLSSRASPAAAEQTRRSSTAELRERPQAQEGDIQQPVANSIDAAPVGAHEAQLADSAWPEHGSAAAAAAAAADKSGPATSLTPASACQPAQPCGPSQDGAAASPSPARARPTGYWWTPGMDDGEEALPKPHGPLQGVLGLHQQKLSFVKSGLGLHTTEVASALSVTPVCRACGVAPASAHDPAPEQSGQECQAAS